MIRYDEPLLVKHLNRIAPPLRVAFAASCAERLFPAYVRFSEQTGRGNPRILRSALDRLWTALVDQAISASDLATEIDSCMAQIPREDEGDWSPTRAYAEDAAAAIAYGLRVLNKGDSQEAAWAARRVYEALDHFVINTSGVDGDGPDVEEQVLQHPLVQAELKRQRRDLEALVVAHSQSRDTRATIDSLRKMAMSEASTFFGSAAPQ